MATAAVLTVLKVAAATAAVVSTVQGISAAREAGQMRAATDEVVKVQAETAKELHDFWKDKYKSLEVRITSEVKDWEPETVDYQTQCLNVTADSKKQFTTALLTIDSLFKEMCITKIDKFILRRVLVNNSDIITDMVNFAYRYAEHITQSRNDRDFARLMQVGGMGRGLMGESLKYSSTAASTFSSLGANAQANSANALRGVGYLLKRNESGGGGIQNITQLLGG